MDNGNLTTTERAVSAAVAGLLTIVSLTRGGLIARAATAAAAGALLLRAISGHCAVKAALTGYSTLADGVRDQVRGLKADPLVQTDGRPGSPLHAARGGAIDEASEESFPASDPPASHLPDEPPSNAEAKWKAARAAGRA
jgi:hypothetical protein